MKPPLPRSSALNNGQLLLGCAELPARPNVTAYRKAAGRDLSRAQQDIEQAIAPLIVKHDLGYSEIRKILKSISSN